MGFFATLLDDYENGFFERCVNKYLPPARDVYDVFKYVHAYSKVLGIMPCNIVGKEIRKRYYVPCTRPYLRMTIIVTVYAIVYYNLYQPSLHPFYDNLNRVDKFVTMRTIPILVYGQFAHIILSFVKQYTLCDIFREINELDIFIEEKLKLQVPDKLNYLLSRIEFISLFTQPATVFYVDACSINDLTVFKWLKIFFTFYLPVITSHVIRMQFCKLILMAGHRFSVLNDGLKDLMERPTQWNNKSTKKLERYIKLTCICHLRVIEISDKANRCFSFEIMVVILENVTQLFVIVFPLCRAANGEYTTMLIITFVCYLLNGIQLTTFVAVCATITKKQATDTACILHRVYNHFDDSKLSALVQFYSIQMQKKKLRFTAGGVFELNLRYVLFMASTIATLIIILFQF